MAQPPLPLPQRSSIREIPTMADSLPIDGTRMKFGIGQPVRRNEDPMLLQGGGRYSDDVAIDGQVFCVMVRSPYAHGVIKGIDTAAAKTMQGVLAVYTAADLAAYGKMKAALPFKNRDGSDMAVPQRAALASDKVRWVGDPVACVVAETRAQARDAAEAVFLDVETLPVVTEASAAAAPGAPLVFDEVAGNVALDFHFGDSAKVQAAFDSATTRAKLPLRNNRIVVSAMEPRAATAQWDSSEEKFTLHLGCQGVFGLRAQMADLMKVPVKNMRILTGNVGGSFGMKASAYPEYFCILHAARELGRPVKWTDDRSGSFVSDQHGRDHEVTGELALDAEGKFLAVRLTAYANLGGYMATVGPLMGTGNFVKNVQSNYATPLIEVNTKCMMTNTTPVSAYRGAGRPEGNYFMERLIEAAAVASGIPAIELRRRNYIPSAAMPYNAASGSAYDGGEFSAVLGQALEAADWNGFDARRAESARRGKLRGRGIGNYLEVTAPPAKEMGGLRFEKDGTVTIITGTLDYGQGHWSAFAQVLHEKLGVPFESIRLLQGDSDQLVAGGGTGGSKSMMASGAAIIEASALVIEKGRIAAAHVLEAATQDIEFAAGRFSIAGTDRGIGVIELNAALRSGGSVPDGVPDTLDVTHVFDNAPSAFPNGCHVCEVEIDPETGVVAVVRYTSVNDFGVVVNPLLVAGQVHGGVAQGIGQALMERVSYSEEGQILSGSYMDYAIPRAADLPAIAFDSHPVPARTNPLGAKGCGEAGCAGSLPSVMNAITDALAPLGVAHIDMPATPEVVWRAIQNVKRAA
jgi:aerobic carbon-monoxide dehydrogenase large subunit